MSSRSRYDLNKNRGLFFQFGLVLALLTVLKIINYTSYTEKPEYHIEDNQFSSPDIIELISLPEIKKKLVHIVKNTEQKKSISHELTQINIATIPMAKPDLNNTLLNTTESRNFRIPEPVISKPKKTETTKDKTLDFAERMPVFGDCIQLEGIEAKQCSDKALLRYLSKNIKYPGLARSVGLEGRVLVEFVIDENGKVSSAKILRDIGAGCGEEVIRVLNQMPDWIPGIQNAQNVKVRMRVPVSFKID